MKIVLKSRNVLLLLSLSTLLVDGYIFEGCYSDADGMILQNSGTLSRNVAMNINSDCAEYCRNAGFAVSSTRGRNCYCTNSLPTPQLFSARSTNAGGAGGSCVTPCPGSALATLGLNRPCQNDECCGGPNAYSVHLVGSIDALLQLERRVIQGVMAQNNSILYQKFPHLKGNLFSGWRQILSDGSHGTSDSSYSPESKVTGRPLPTYTATKSDSGSNKFYTLDIDYPEDATLFEVSQKLIPSSSHTGTVYFVYRDAAGNTVRYSYKPSVTINRDTFITESVPEGVRGVRRLTLGYLGPQNIFLWEAKGKGHMRLNLEVLASGVSASSDGIGGIKTYKLLYDTHSKAETLTEPGLQQGLSQLDMSVINMEKVLDFQETPEETPLGSRFQCVFTFAGDSSDCLRRYQVQSVFEETFSTQAGLDVRVTVGAEFAAGALFTSFKTTFELSIGVSFSFGYSATTTTSMTNVFQISASPPAGSKAVIFFSESHIPTMLKWRATIRASGDLKLTVNGVQKELDISELLVSTQRNLFAFGSIDYGKEHFIIGHVQITDVNGNLINNMEESQQIMTNAESGLQNQ